MSLELVRWSAMTLIYSRRNPCICVWICFACRINANTRYQWEKLLYPYILLGEYKWLGVCNLCGWCRRSYALVGTEVLAMDYRWLAGFWISFLWYPLNVFIPFEVMSVLKYLSPFMYNHRCLRSRILLSPPTLFFRWKHQNSQHPSKCTKVWGKSRRKRRTTC